LLLSTSRKFIFLANRKTGTYSVERALAAYGDPADPYDLARHGRHVPAATVRSAVPAELWDSSFKFAFVRNPYDWITSQWFYCFGLKLKGRPRLGDPYRRLHKGLRNRKWLRFTDKRPSPGNLATRRLFTPDDLAFLFDILGRDTFPWVGHHQKHFALDEDGRQIVDFVGRFENMSGDFAEIARRIGVNVDLSISNQSLRGDWRGYFDAKSGQAAYDLWRADFEAFGYERFVGCD
jgi:hypothetical protein